MRQTDSINPIPGDRRKSRDRRSVPRGGRRQLDVAPPVDIDRNNPSLAPLLLVVDDFLDVLEMATELLTHLGFRVESAHTGVEAIEKVARLHPDLVIMDVRLPDIDGIDVIARIRGLDVPQPQFVIWTAAVLSDVRARATAANVVFVPKPCDLIVLGRQIQHLLSMTADAAPFKEAPR